MVKQVSVYIDDENHEWLEDQVRKGKFKSISQAIRECIADYRDACPKGGKHEKGEYVGRLTDDSYYTCTKCGLAFEEEN